MDCISCHPEGENHMQELKLKRVYRHFKGDYYLVEDVAKDSETGEEYVVYRKLYGDGSPMAAAKGHVPQPGRSGEISGLSADLPL